MGWEHYQTAEPLKREPQVSRELFGVLILHFKFPNSMKSSTFRHIFRSSTYPLRKTLFPKMPKNHSKIYPNIG